MSNKLDEVYRRALLSPYSVALASPHCRLCLSHFNWGIFGIRRSLNTWHSDMRLKLSYTVLIFATRIYYNIFWFCILERGSLKVWPSRISIKWINRYSAILKRQRKACIINISTGQLINIHISKYMHNIDKFHPDADQMIMPVTQTFVWMWFEHTAFSLPFRVTNY